MFFPVVIHIVIHRFSVSFRPDYTAMRVSNLLRCVAK